MATSTAKKITTSFTVSFTSSDANGILIAEVDNRDVADGGLNSKTSFAPGDTVYYLIYKGPGVVVDAQYHSWGQHSAVSTGLSIPQEEILTFMAPDDLAQTVKYPVDTIDSWEWLGNTTFDTPKFNGQDISVNQPSGSTYGVGILKVKYTTKADAYKLTHAPLGYPEYEIATLVVGTFTPPTT